MGLVRSTNLDGRTWRRLSWVVVAAVALAVAAALGACSSGGSSLTASGTPEPAGSPMTLKVMEFNIENGGTQISFAKVVEAVKDAAPDVVGIEEAQTNTARLARLAGFPYANAGMQIVSKYPILEPSGANGRYALIEVQPGKAVALANVHLPSAPYAPHFIVSHDWPLRWVLRLEKRVRLPAIAGQLDALPPLARAGMPVFITGDFNSPSSLDYTAAAVGHNPGVKYPVEWPVSAALLKAGLRDSFRQANPDPVAMPGITWPAARPKVSGWNPGKADGQDRIDFIYDGGPVQTLASQVVGEKADAEASVTVSPWPSDHRAVVSTFQVRPAELPVMVATDRWLYTQGQDVTMTYHRSAGGDWSVAWQSADGARTVAISTEPAQAADGNLRFGVGNAPSGQYRIALLHDGAVVAQTPIWVRSANGKVALTTDKSSYASGEPIVVTWQNAPANRWDWLGIYKASAADPNVDYYLDWQYTGGAMSGTVHGMPSGSFTFAKTGHEGSPWPLPPGRYVVYYLLADAYQAAAKASFTVTK